MSWLFNSLKYTTTRKYYRELRGIDAKCELSTIVLDVFWFFSEYFSTLLSCCFSLSQKFFWIQRLLFEYNNAKLNNQLRWSYSTSTLIIVIAKSGSALVPRSIFHSSKISLNLIQDSSIILNHICKEGF